ncbi:hypothetical protein ABW20_dc0108972 [Dactylellina cionopaga]|nr:hypothetical protein ABW20_dc0108972 [Dactylellina cionopaga]
MRFESSNVQLAAAERLQGDAIAAVRKGNYKVAIDKLTEAINMQPAILMALLDNRAALYDKTDQLKMALKDAKTMMNHEKTNPKGYLRAGRILHRMDKASLAVDIYKLGLKHVEPSDPQLPRLKEILEKALDKQNRAMKAAIKKIYDPMQVLPLELIEMILDYLSFRNIVAMQRVSKTWQTVISSNARFWATLDFSRARKPITRAALKNCINKSKYTLTKAILNRIHNFNDTTLIDMVSVCKDLEYMKVMDGFMGSSLTRAMQLTKSLRTLILHCQIPFTTFEALINPELPLEHLECWHLGPTKEFVPPYDNQLTHLRVGLAKHIGFQDLAEHYFNSKAINTLEELSVEGDYDFSNKSIPVLYELPSLKRVDFSLTSLNGAGLYQFLRYSKSGETLKEVIMNGTERVSEDLANLAANRGIKLVQVKEGGKEWQLLQGENMAPFFKLERIP